MEAVNFQMSYQKIAFVICGMYEINFKLFIAFMVFSFSSVIILIQFDLKYND